jgi:hypothetical protein
MALTLIEAAKIALGKDEAYKAAVMELYAKNSDVLATMPFENITGNALSFNREKVLPGVGFRGVNEAYVESTGKVEPITERLTIAGGDIDVDKFLVDTGGPDQRSTQEALKIKALSLSMTKTVIKGSVLTDPKGFDGFQVRLNGSNLIGNHASSATPLSLLKLDELIDTVDDPTHLIMNKTMRRRLTVAARTYTIGGFVTYDVDSFGRRVTKYNDLPILIADKDETNTDILPFTETDVAGGSVGSSVYCTSFNETGIVGLQAAEMDVRDLGELETKPAYRTRIEWYITLAMYRPFAGARLYGFIDKAITA